MDGDRIEFHTRRAAAELELAREARHLAAARAHFGLSALHVERLSRLIEASPALAER